MLDTISNVIDALDKRIIETEIGNPHFNPNNYEVFPIEESNFYQLDKKISERNVVFIDGGNQELLGAPNFSIQLNRVYFNMFKGISRIVTSKLPQRLEFLSVTVSDWRNSEIYYDTLVFPFTSDWKKYLPNESDLSFSSRDRTIAVGDMRADIQRVSSIARRFSEWSYARHIVEQEMKETDILVVDGTLQTAFTHEDNYLNDIRNSTMKKGVILSGLSKTSALFTTTGVSLLGHLGKIVEDWNIRQKPWFYKVAEGLNPNHSAIIFITKLHESSSHLFRYEINKKQSDKIKSSEINDIIGNIASNSNDISFPGYPYGLIDADDNARVRDDELETYRIILLSQLSDRGIWKKFERYIHTSDAHEVLNSLKGVVNV